MIHPNMATMLAFIASDAAIAPDALDQALKSAVDQSFNRISVDGDTSTNDACVVMASGHSNAPLITRQSQTFDAFQEALTEVCQELAEAIVRVGEGATKLMRVVVEQAESEQEAHQVAATVATSPLVKTALFAADPNWGRILGAVGRAPVNALDVTKINILLGDVAIVRNGERAGDYTERAGQAVMDRDEVVIRIQLGRGVAQQSVLSCDLSYEYVRINAEYRS